ncbi:MAG: insulinase family protein [Phycisphaerales bacterium]|nr:insulinase family protein [Phycisphaerales bacterium]
MPVAFHHHQLPNGLTIVAEADPDAHTAAAGFFVRTGARDEAPPVMGVSHFLEHMMFKGTDRRSAEDVNRQFDELGAKYNAYTTSEVTCFYAQVLPERLDAASEILADILRPALRDDDFTTEKGVILEEIAMYKDQPFWTLYERAMEEHYAAHPLAHRVLGTTGTVGALTSSQMREYFTSRYSADNTTLALAGRLDFDHAVRHIEALCHAWQTTRPQRDVAPPAPPRGASFTLEDEKVTRAYWLMISPAPSAQDPRRYAAMMLAQVLGGTDNSRLHWALIETGVAEEAQAAYDPRDGCGDTFVFASGDPERADEIVAAVNREIDNLVPSLTPDDLQRLRNRLATGVTLAGERPGGRMQRIGRQWIYNRAYRTLEEELEAINAVTLDDLREVSRAFPMNVRTVGLLRPKPA